MIRVIKKSKINIRDGNAKVKETQYIGMHTAH